MRLSSKIIIKDYSEGDCFVLDLEDENDAFYKCTDVFADLVHFIYKLDNFTDSRLFHFLKEKYPDVDDSILNRDINSFIDFLKEKKFLSE